MDDWDEPYGQALNSMISQLDEFIAMANDPETIGFIRDEQIALGQIKTRVDLILSYLNESKPALKVVSNG